MTRPPISLSKLLDLRPATKRIALVSCGSAKISFRTEARYLYKSPLFQNSIYVANAIADEVFVLSALYGLVRQDEVLDPYDLSLKSFDSTQSQQWGDRIAEKLSELSSFPTEAILFAGSSYVDPIASSLANSRITLKYPFKGLPLGLRGSKIKRMKKIVRRGELAIKLYSVLARQIRQGVMAPLTEILKGNTLPEKGVYIFCDPSEDSNLHVTTPRIVRIGTHAVSSGSKSTLRSRLRTHAGSADGRGSHRSSIFRLHIGQSLIAKNSWELKYPHWGKGSTASSEIRESERDLEQEVSSYMGQLLVTTLPLVDDSGPGSARAHVERALVALLTEDMDFLEESSSAWLGRFSSRPQLQSSGIWNVQHVGATLDTKSVNLAINLLERSIS
ncbi:hypothetical protein HMPREF9696_02412 [Afipia clevelandensis ATCC 49720]|uniref:SIR2-like domain-containing protein n=1 Tax=Afipia clevelandensis ATCC 49720 TaxID=883079 RepID=K8P670_9BRAD|nr:hypothetical protein HMPREF9696_02412 [Afipia clevelandensis ATCC 49720]